MTSPHASRRFSSSRAGWFIASVTALAYAGALALISDALNDGNITHETARWSVIGASIAAGVIYLVGNLWARSNTTRRMDLAVILLAGLVARSILLPSTPIFVSDFYRYLLDGAVTAAGENPFQFSPDSIQSALDGEPGASAVPPEILKIAKEGRRSIRWINHPELATIYPPVAQATFAAAYWIKPWSVGALRVVFLLFDLATVLLLMKLLAMLGQPLHHVAWYWLNPIMLREVSHSAHMDVIALPFVVASVILVLRSRHISASISIAVAIAAKIWPVILIPLLIRRIGSARRAILAAACLVSLSILLWWPTFSALDLPNGGFRAYGSSWERNDAAFQAIAWTIDRFMPSAQEPAGQGAIAPRVAVAIILLAYVLWQSIKPLRAPRDLVRQAALATALLFILSPAPFPWYYSWMLPLLAAAPRISLLAYTVTLPLYLAQFAHPWVVWIEHLPILAWFAIGSIRNKQIQPPAPDSLEPA